MRNRRGRGGVKGRARNHADINCPTPFMCAFSKAEAEEKWWPYSPSLRAWAIFHFVTIRKPCASGSSLVSVIYVTPPPPSVSRSRFFSRLYRSSNSATAAAAVAARRRCRRRRPSSLMEQALGCVVSRRRKCAARFVALGLAFA